MSSIHAEVSGFPFHFHSKVHSWHGRHRHTVGGVRPCDQPKRSTIALQHWTWDKIERKIEKKSTSGIEFERFSAAPAWIGLFGLVKCKAQTACAICGSVQIWPPRRCRGNESTIQGLSTFEHPFLIEAAATDCAWAFNSSDACWCLNVAFSYPETSSHRGWL